MTFFCYFQLKILYTCRNIKMGFYSRKSNSLSEERLATTLLQNRGVNLQGPLEHRQNRTILPIQTSIDDLLLLFSIKKYSQ